MRRNSRASPRMIAGVPSRLQPSTRAHSSAATASRSTSSTACKAGLALSRLDSRISSTSASSSTMSCSICSLYLHLAGLAVELDGEPQPRQRRAQFVRRVRQQQAVRIHQLLDARRPSG